MNNRFLTRADNQYIPVSAIFEYFLCPNTELPSETLINQLGLSPLLPLGSICNCTRLFIQ